MKTSTMIIGMAALTLLSGWANYSIITAAAPPCPVVIGATK